MTEDQKWAAISYAYNHGEGHAYAAIDKAEDVSDTNFSSLTDDKYVRGIMNTTTYLNEHGPLATAPGAGAAEYNH